MILSKSDVSFLKRADAFTFRHYADNTGEINAYTVDRWSQCSQRMTARVDSSVEDYSNGIAPAGGNRYVAFEHVRAYRTLGPSPTSTAFDSLRSGDEIELRWMHGNDSENTRQAGMVTDELRVHVKRDGITKRVYTISYSVVPANSIARMVKLA